MLLWEEEGTQRHLKSTKLLELFSNKREKPESRLFKRTIEFTSSPCYTNPIL